MSQTSQRALRWQVQRGERMVPTGLEEAPVQPGTCAGGHLCRWASGVMWNLLSVLTVRPGWWARLTPAVCFGRSRELKKELKDLPDLLSYRWNGLWGTFAPLTEVWGRLCTLVRVCLLPEQDCSSDWCREVALKLDRSVLAKGHYFPLEKLSSRSVISNLSHLMAHVNWFLKFCSTPKNVLVFVGLTNRKV